MRISTIFLLGFWAIVGACGRDSPHLGGPSDRRDAGRFDDHRRGDPDRDGFQLTIDGVNSVTLEPTDSAQVIISAGRHALGCKVSRGNARSILGCRWTWTSRRRERHPWPSRSIVPRLALASRSTTTGLDIDQDGYRVTVDGIDQAPIPSNAVAFFRSEPGSRTIALTGLASNCAFTGPASQTVTIVPNEPAPVEFAVVCTATTGVIEVSLSTSGTDTGGPYQVFVDGVQQSQFLTSSEPEAIFVEPIFVSGGDHLLSLTAPSNCSVGLRRRS